MMERNERMRKLGKIFYCNAALLLLALLLAGCAGSKNVESKQTSNDETAAQTDENHHDNEDSNKISKDESEPTTGSEESTTGESDDTSSEKAKMRRKIMKTLDWQRILLKKSNMPVFGCSLGLIKR